MSRFALGIFGVSALFLGGVAGEAAGQKSPRPLPAVDQAAPKKVETATLALG